MKINNIDRHTIAIVLEYCWFRNEPALALDLLKKQGKVIYITKKLNSALQER